MSKSLIAVAALGSLAAMFAATGAEAKRGSAVVAHGPEGRGVAAHRSVDRDVGSKSVSSGIHTADGRSAHTQRDKSWGNGSYSGSASHELGNGQTAGRDVNATANGDGTLSYSASRTGFDGSTNSKSGTVGTPR